MLNEYGYIQNSWDLDKKITPQDCDVYQMYLDNQKVGFLQKKRTPWGVFNDALTEQKKKYTVSGLLLFLVL